MKSRLFVLLCVSLFLALGVTAACSSGEGDSDEQSLPTATEPAPEAPAETAETTEPRDDDDELTAEEYFQRFDAIDADVDAKLEALLEDFPFPEGDEGSFSEEDLRVVKDVTDRSAEVSIGLEE